jgi:adenylate cyclase
MATVLFADVRGFTTFAERSTAREAVAFLNAFFAAAVPAITRHDGWAHKLLGDGLLAVFTAGTHADNAVTAAEDMLAAVDCPIGVGVNSGLVLVGEVGGGGLVEHGVVGDPVNVAARVQDATRELGEPLLVTEATRLLMETDALQPRGSLTLKGRARPVTLYGRGTLTPSGAWPS